MNKSVPQKCIYLHLVKVFNLTMCIKSTSKDMLGCFISRGRDDRESFLQKYTSESRGRASCNMFSEVFILKSVQLPLLPS